MILTKLGNQSFISMNSHEQFQHLQLERKIDTPQSNQSLN